MTRILIVEDQPRLATAMAHVLRAAGFDIGVSPSVASGLRAVGAHGPDRAGGVDAAILDINVEDGLVFPLADELTARGIPFAFCSSMHPGDLPHRLAGTTFLRKPFDLDDLVAMAASLRARLPLGGRGDHKDAPTPRSGG